MASKLPRLLDTASKFALFSVSGFKDEKFIKQQTYVKTETCKLFSRDFWVFLPNFIKIDPYNFYYRPTVSKLVRFLRHSVGLYGRVSYRFRDIDAFSSKIACFLPHPCLTPTSGGTHYDINVITPHLHLTGYNFVQTRSIFIRLAAVCSQNREITWNSDKI